MATDQHLEIDDLFGGAALEVPAAAPSPAVQKSAPKPAATGAQALAPSTPTKLPTPAPAKIPTPTPTKLPAPTPAKLPPPAPAKAAVPAPAKAPGATGATPKPAAPRAGGTMFSSLQKLSSQSPEASQPSPASSSKPRSGVVAKGAARSEPAEPAEPPIELVKDAVIGGKYRLDRLLKAGGMGAVWIATHLTLDTPVAIKFMSMPIDDAVTSSKQGPGSNDSAISRARFEREAKTAAQIRSANVVQILDYGVDRSTAYIVMELLDGQDLEQRLRRTRLPLDQTAKIIIPVLLLLQRAHDAGMVHRDLKPANIFLAKDGEAEVPKVLDFGVAKAVQKAASTAGDLTSEKTLIGTPHYAAPEQIKCSDQIDHRADLWSMGVVIFRMLTGKKPFRGAQLVEAIVEVCSAPIPKATSMAADLPPEVDAFFERALEREVDRRFQSAREMAQALGDLVEAVAKRPAPAQPASFIVEDTTHDGQGSFSGARTRPPASGAVSLAGSGPRSVPQPPQDGGSAPEPPSQTSAPSSVDLAPPVQSTQLAQARPANLPDAPPKRPGWQTPALVALALGVSVPVTAVLVRRSTPAQAASTAAAAVTAAPTAAPAPSAPAAGPTAAAGVAPTSASPAALPSPTTAPASPTTAPGPLPAVGGSVRRPHAAGAPSARATAAATAKPSAPASREDKEVGY